MTEVELKLALPVQAAASLLRQLARLPLLAGSDRRRQQLHNIYYDTRDHQLLHQGVVLRVRRVGNGVRAVWWQTLKIGDRGASALSRRGEWEARLRQPELSAALLADTPWTGIDPHGALFAQLQPCFHTEFTRSRWMPQLADGSLVEVALDQGQIVAGTRREPICELELELKVGPPSALFDIALQIAQVVPVIPASASKSERAYALLGTAPGGSSAAQDTAAVDDLARAALCTAWSQFTSHLIALRSDDDPEQVHQARVAWRRFRSARRLFRPILAKPFPDVELDLEPLLTHLGDLRDLDVARTESLPRLSDTYIAGSPIRATAWRRMVRQLAALGEDTRMALRHTLVQPATGQALTRITQWLDGLTPEDAVAGVAAPSRHAARAWAVRRLRRQRRVLRDAHHSADDDTRRHEVRILAKRLRYGVDMLEPLLPVQRARRWRQVAVRLQREIGDQRDAMQAAVLVGRLRGHLPIAEFLREHASALASALQPKRGV